MGGGKEGAEPEEGEMRNISKFAVGLEKLSSLKGELHMKRQPTSKRLR